MNRAEKLFAIFSLLWVTGCATVPPKPFVAVGQPLNRSAKPPSDVQIFFNPSSVTFPYAPIGNVYSESTPDRHQSAKDQITYIRDVAAANGADAVIVSKQVLLKGGTYEAPSEGLVHQAEIAIYSGIAIVKNPNGAMPVSTSTAPASSDTVAEPSVPVFSDPSQVPFPYIPIAELNPKHERNTYPSANDQIAALRAQAATEGADGVIVSYKILEQTGTYRAANQDVAIPIPIAIYSGIAISKTSANSK